MERLTEWKVGGTVTGTWTYDNMGNRLSQIEGTISTLYQYSGNQLYRTTAPTSTTSYVYNTDGSLTNRTKLEQNVGMFQRTFETFRYNSAGLTDQYLLAELTGTDTSCLTTTQVERWVDWRYRYNSGGTREQKREYAGTEPDTLDAYYEWTYYLLGAGSEQRAVWKGAQTKQPDTCGTIGEHVTMWATEYLVYGALGLEIITKDSVGTEVKEVRFTDHLGSTRATYSTTGSRTGTDYKPFGSVLWNINGSTARTFIGQESDAEMDLGDFGARKYDATIGRFTAIDPLFEMYPSFTPYNYCNNNPINYIDPTGESMMDLIILSRSVGACIGVYDPSMEACDLERERNNNEIMYGGSAGSVQYMNTTRFLVHYIEPDPLTPGHYIFIENPFYKDPMLNHTGEDPRFGNGQFSGLGIGFGFGANNGGVNTGNDYFDSKTGQYLGTDKGNTGDIRFISKEDFQKGNLSASWYVYYSDKIGDDKGIHDDTQYIGANIFEHYLQVVGIYTFVNGNFSGIEGVSKSNQVYFDPAVFNFRDNRVQNKFDIISLAIHTKVHLEQHNAGQFAETAAMRSTMERKALLAQVQDPSWKYTSTRFKTLFVENGYADLLTPLEFQQYFGNYGIKKN